MSRILLAEDEEHIRSIVKLNLELEGYIVKAVETGGKAVKEFEQASYDLVILDVMLPELSGFDVCEKIRMVDSHTPILFLTAKGTSEDKVNGLKIGGDDYLTKPFHLEEFLLRVQKLVRRNAFVSPGREMHAYSFGNNKVDFLTYSIETYKGEKFTLSKREVMLLKLLIEKKDEVVSRDHILKTVWGYDVYPSTRTIDNYILAFRKYFEKDARHPEYFHSIRGVGYKFTDEN